MGIQNYGRFERAVKVYKNKPLEKGPVQKSIKATEKRVSYGSTKKVADSSVPVIRPPAAVELFDYEEMSPEKTFSQKPCPVVETPSSKSKKDPVKISRTVGIFHSISTKLIGIISVIVLVSVAAVTFVSATMFSNDTKVNAEDNNLTINKRTAGDLENKIESVKKSVAMFLDLIYSNSGNEFEIKRNTENFFSRNKEISAVYLLNSGKCYKNNDFFLEGDLDSEVMASYVLQSDESVEKAKTGICHIENGTPVFNVPELVIFFPVNNGEETDVVVVAFESESFAESIEASVNASFFVNSSGNVLVHSDTELMKSNADMESHKLVQLIKNENEGEVSQNAIQSNYVSDDGLRYIGAYKRLSNCDGYVITEVQSDVIFGAVQKTTKLSLYIAIAVLALAVLFIRFYARSIARPLELLTAITNEINGGNFNTNLFEELNESRKDEIGVLNRSTKDERDILNTVTSLTNQGVTKAIVKKTIDFEPHLKDITIFFSDIRGFTAISDGFSKRFGEKSAGEIISFLNDYMSRMVACISLTGGNVDKFEGDAIMACWGVLRDDDLSYELMDDSNPEKARLREIHDQHVRHDTISAIKATIGMRYALMKYNKDAEAFTKLHADEPLAKYKPHIQIGCGLNVGRATVGFMGSKEKMEFTSIGDAVNLASRTESSNKPCGTDILLSQDTYDLLKYDYIRSEENNYTISPKYINDEIVVEQIPVTFDVKGKGKQHFYGVVNMPRFDIEAFFKRAEPDFTVDEDCARACGPAGPQTLNEVRNMLNIPIPDFDKVDLNAEENKIQVS